MAEVIVREAGPEEYDEVGGLLVDAYAQYGPHDGASQELVDAYDAYRRDIRDVRSRLHDSQLLVAEADGRLLGSVTYYPPHDGVVGEGWPAGWAGFRLLAVHPSARGSGIGRLLSEECVRRARADGAPVLGLHTTIVMTVAREMYERMGFVRAPEFDFPVSPDFTVWGYRLDLG